METELRDEGIKYESEVITPIMYKNYYVGYGRADIVINRSESKEVSSTKKNKQPLIVELKALSSNQFKTTEISRLRTYMKSLGINRGIMVNFGQTPSTSNKCNFHCITL